MNEIEAYQATLYKLLDVDELSGKDLRALHDKHNPPVPGGDLELLAGAHKSRIHLGIRVGESLAWLYEHGFKPPGITDDDLEAGNYLEED